MHALARRSRPESVGLRTRQVGAGVLAVADEGEREPASLAGGSDDVEASMNRPDVPS